MQIRNRPLLTDTFSSLSAFVPDGDSVYVHGSSGEERSAHSPEWEAKASDVLFVRITAQSETSFSAEGVGQTQTVMLRSEKQLDAFWKYLDRKHLYLDITGLDHKVWAPLVKSALRLGLLLTGVYVEPGEYRFSRGPREGDIFDLSDRIDGIAPLPGFAYFNESSDAEVQFVPLLGFEGIRFKHVLEQMQPAKANIIPVVGVPGFRPEYPFFTYEGNRPVLDETGAWSRIRYARANCPFSLFYTLEDIAAASSGALLKISLIGTKPHALGAVLYSLLSPRAVELVYDHPIRRQERTLGSSRVLVYKLSALSLATWAP